MILSLTEISNKNTWKIGKFLENILTREIRETRGEYINAIDATLSEINAVLINNWRERQDEARFGKTSFPLVISVCREGGATSALLARTTRYIDRPTGPTHP